MLNLNEFSSHKGQTALSTRGYAGPSDRPSISSRPGVAILGNSSSGNSCIQEACLTCEFKFQDFANVTSIAEQSAKLGLRLAVVHQNASGMPYRTMIEYLRSAGFSRVVLVGPAIGSDEFIVALDVGFDEVWPATMPFDLTCALLHKALQTASKLSEKESRPVLSIGSLSIDQNNNSCTFAGHTLFLGREAFILLSRLVLEYPEPASRNDLAKVAGRNCGDEMGRSRALDMAIMRLRKKLNAFTDHQLTIRAVETIGYRLAVSEAALTVMNEIVCS